MKLRPNGTTYSNKPAKTNSNFENGIKLIYYLVPIPNPVANKPLHFIP